MNKAEMLSVLHKLTQHQLVEITPSGDAAIAAALSIVPKNKVLLIPEEGGWLSYKKIPAKLGLQAIMVKCDDAKINLADLQQKLIENSCASFLYQNPGGYFAEQPMREIYELCQKYDCLVIMDVSGSIGTKLCNGGYADILLGSFGQWKLVEAKVGGFVSCTDTILFEKIKNVEVLKDTEKLNLIFTKIQELPERISFLQGKRKKIIKDLGNFDIVHKADTGFVVVVKYHTNQEKEKIINYCTSNKWPWREGPRYIRLNKPAISIEVKQVSR